MKLMLIRHWADMCGMLLLSMTAIPRPGMVAADLPCRASRASKVHNRQRHQPSFATKPLYIAGLQLLAGFSLSIAPAMALEAPESTTLDSTMTWNLTEAKVISKGQVEVLREGEFTHDFILESKVTAINPSGSVVPGGTLRLVLSAFSPAYDQRGQKKGAWYVGGLWTLTDSTISPSTDGKHRAGEMSGRIKAELTFNPFVTPKNWTANLWLPMTRIAPAAQAASSQPARGEGALTLDDKREGKLSLTLRLWPTMQH